MAGKHQSGFGGSFQYLGGTTPGWRTGIMRWELFYGINLMPIPRQGVHHVERINGRTDWHADLSVLIPNDVDASEMKVGNVALMELLVNGTDKFAGGGTLENFQVRCPPDGPVSMDIRIRCDGSTGNGNLEFKSTGIIDDGAF